MSRWNTWTTACHGELHQGDTLRANRVETSVCRGLCIKGGPMESPIDLQNHSLSPIALRVNATDAARPLGGGKLTSLAEMEDTSN
jgi:hypothetical protein